MTRRASAASRHVQIYHCHVSLDFFISFRLIGAQIIDLISSLTAEAALQIPLPSYHDPTVSFLSERSLSLWRQVRILSYSDGRISRPFYKCPTFSKEPTFGTTKPSRSVISPPAWCMFIFLEDRRVQAGIRL